MGSKQCYENILGIHSPWQVVEVEISLLGKKVTMTVSHTGDGYRCPH